MRLHVAPDFRGDAEAWMEALSALPPGAELHLLGTTDSTNLRLRERSRPGGVPQGMGSFSVVVAEAQEAGRGREGRRWDSPAGGGLWISVLLPPPPGGLPGVTPLAVGVAAAEAIEALLRDASVQVGLKWPNDLLLDGAKVGGILCEGIQGPGGGAGRGRPAEAGGRTSGAMGVVAGIGINLWRPDPGTGEGGRGEPASGDGSVGRASAEGVKPLPRGGLFDPPGAGREGRIDGDALRRGLARALLGALLRHADPPPDLLTGSLRQGWERRDVLRDRPLVVTPGPRGVGAGVTEDGALLVRPFRGKGPGPGGLHPVRAGQVRLLQGIRERSS